MGSPIVGLLSHMNIKVLEKIGLSSTEARIYVTLLGLGSTPSSRVVNETGLRKSTVYDSIRRLQEKGLASYVIKGSMRYFEAADPDRLIDFLEERKRLIDEYEGEVTELIPKLKEGYAGAKPHAEAHVFSGVEGFKTMRRDALRKADGELLLLGAISRESEVMPAFYKNWNISRQLRRVRMRVLHKESARKKTMTDRKFMGEYFETRFLPSEFESPAVINIYGDRVVDVLWKGDNPICFMLINRDIADSYRKYFNYLWVEAKE